MPRPDPCCFYRARGYILPTTKLENRAEDILHNHVRHVQDNRILVPARFSQCPETSEQGIQADRKTVLQTVRGILKKMQVPRVEDVVTGPHLQPPVRLAQ
jgi:hypothetical protein